MISTKLVAATLAAVAITGVTAGAASASTPTVTPGGRVVVTVKPGTTTWAGGKITLASPYGKLPDGIRLKMKPNGSTWALQPDGSTWAMVPDGSTWA